MTKTIALSVVGLSVWSLSLMAQFQPFQRDDSYTVFLNLRGVQQDQLPVQIVPPVVTSDSVEFHMPRIIPGTYAIEDYGRYVNNFKALNSRGEALKVNRVDTNRWRIYDADQLYKITYKVEDTYDLEESSGIFEPAGTSLEEGVYLLNNFGFIGYLDEYQDHPFDLQVAKQAGFYGSTSLSGQRGDTLDIFSAGDYFAVHDNPIMYCRPDTAVKRVGGAEVMVSVYSPNQTVNATRCMERIAAVLDAAAVYLGGELPVDQYTVLIYCVPLDQAGSSYGALEHHTSTVLYMPEFDGEQFYGGVRDITSHEFFHIVTPLNIHSEQIADFNFINPEMSRHIWLYEGVTEYNSHLVQIRSGIYEMDEFLKVIKQKIESDEKFNAYIPLTVSSQYTLEFFKDQYYNFYQKGAIAGMALDLKLRSLSGTEYGLVDLLMELGDTYGADTFFKDQALFDIITRMTYPEMREFFARHFEGSDPFPLNELLQEAGINYAKEQEYQRITLGRVTYGYNFDTQRIRVEEIEELSSFGRDLDLREGDELVELNDQEVNLENVSDLFINFYQQAEPGDKLEMVVARPKGDDFKKKKLKAEAQLGTVMRTHVMEVMENPTPSQLKMRKAWINQ